MLIFLLWCSAIVSLAQPKLEIKETKKNFGFVQRGTVVKNVYEIKNTGNQPLIFTGSEVSCSCTSVDLPAQPVLPGASDEIVIIFNTATVYGRQDRVVSVSSNAPKGEVKLRYKGVVSNK